MNKISRGIILVFAVVVLTACIAAPVLAASVTVNTHLDNGANLEGVVIFLDGFEVNKTTGSPVAFLTVSDLSVSSHELRAVYNGQEKVEKFIVDNEYDSKIFDMTFSVTAGSISVISSPVGASVYFENEFVGRTPYLINDLEPGEYKVEVKMDGYNSESRKVTVVAKETKNEQFYLNKVQGTGSVVISSSPDKADVYFDGDYRGPTLTSMSQVEPGTHVVLIELKGYESLYFEIDIEAGKTLYVDKILKKLPDGVEPQQTPILGKTGISVFCTNTRANVYLDDDFIGKTPIENYIKNIDSGKHKIVLKVAGYMSYVDEIDVVGGKINTISVTLDKIGAEEETPKPTTEPTAEPQPTTEVPTIIPTVSFTTSPTTAVPTESPASPMPLFGIIAAISACALFMRRT